MLLPHTIISNGLTLPLTESTTYFPRFASYMSAFVKWLSLCLFTCTENLIIAQDSFWFITGEAISLRFTRSCRKRLNPSVRDSCHDLCLHQNYPHTCTNVHVHSVRCWLFAACSPTSYHLLRSFWQTGWMGVKVVVSLWAFNYCQK